ncbi:MAG: peptidoglycan recognition protein family protein [Planctomycetota bacterium]|nr:peptidoglycan recognition protein family protein [Planctomycetota bacterium]
MRNPNTWRARAAACVLPFLALAVLPGCGDKNRSAAKPPATERVVADAPYTPRPEAAPAPQVTQVSPTIKLYGPLPPDEFQRLLDSPGVTNVGIAKPAAPAPAAAPAYAAADPSWNVPLRADWKYIVLHHSASATGSAASFDRAHKARGWDGLGYHFVIGNGSGSGDGEVEVGYRWKQQERGAHAGNAEFNTHGVGICLVGNFEETHPTPRQMAALNALVRYLQGRCNVPASRIIGHGDVPGKDTQCPGKHFSIGQFRAQAGSGGAISTVSAATSKSAAPARTSALMP